MTIRATTLLALAAAVFLVLTGCDGGEQSKQTAPAETTSDSGEATSATERDMATEEAQQAAAEQPAESQSEAPATSEAASSEAEGSEPTQVAAAGGGEAAAQQLGCTACHAATTKLVGPSYQAVAERYNGDKAKILDLIKDNVKNGASGNWTEVTGGTPMPPQPQAVGKTEQLTAIAEWIAGMAE